MAESQSQSQDKASGGKLYVVGIGPGSVEQLTLKAREVILNADYVLGNSTYLDQMESLLGTQEVIRSFMGKEVERARKAVELAKNANVVMISGGDTNVYGMAGIVLEVAEHENLDVDIEILPGVTAVLAGASLLGAPVVTDFAVISLSDLLTPWEVIEKRLNMAADADFVIGLYNPKSRKRKSNFARAIEIIRKYKAGSVPVGLVKNAMRGEEEDQIVTTLGEVMEYEDWVDMSTAILIGNGESRIWKSPKKDIIITPRGYHKKYDY
ncbi:Cobalt-precorrin-3b C17-methyltransferase [Methanosarcina siciliae C2J]|uniref:Cobalt-precorrin-3b C17-methyltransferase n=3 Tax=Methanosarcina siciliae TaxID=38027 RepID=A0A0E3PHP8_9EURY|nr:precorrin-3B C(17)-methyltransferase [Methanosarcina siciliae]AKB30148.1 Cobalt-precorrin-3b C17-methyltransferase [Methanosarcina siciliae T4/M]AKB34050.1 Cobalt-precorrin-3b C17-methyltransferase [Methanosarcina siciliae HI350]AKB38416.1 Cobalt-precorrin-3b C17-methyltransferase [Methanosarcina siciliae C2J]